MTKNKIIHNYYSVKVNKKIPVFAGFGGGTSNAATLLKYLAKKSFNQKPSIAITGLNPHCENNSKDNEEKTIIIPAIKYLKRKSLKIKGPFPADSLFMRENIKKFDVVIGMYHDQVLIPIKTIYKFTSKRAY